MSIYQGRRRAAKGDTGEGIASGGTTGQSLVKSSNDDYDTEWGDAGSGDMTKVVYDPTTVEGDAFDMDNMVEGTTTKIMTNTERTKLSGVEDNATADQTGAEIKILYEAELDTNAFTDAEQTKLSGIETGAEVNLVDSVNGATGVVVLDADDIADGSTYAIITLVQETNFETAYTHSQGDGSDHAFIDQDVTSGSSPIFDEPNVDGIQFNLSPTITSAEGKMHWNADDGTLEIGMPGGVVNLQIGQENVIRVTNNSGSAMSNGDVVYVSGGLANKPTVALADADNVATSGVIGVLTEDIANNASGYVTTFGLVRDIDTSSFSAGQLLWLSQTAGNLTSTRPTQPAIGVVTAICISSHATEGIILVKTQIVDRLVGLSDVLISGQSDNDFIYWDNATSTWKAKSLTASDVSDFDTEVSNNTDVAANTTHRGSDGKDHSDVVLNNSHRVNTSNPHSVIASQINIVDSSDYYNSTEIESALAEIRQTNADQNDPTGFPNRTDSTISFTDGTRTFSIQPTATNFSYYEAGKKYTTTGDTKVITDVEGLHVIYYDGSTLTEAVNPSVADTDTLIRTKALVSYIYWDTSAASAIYVGEERHGMQMSGATHAYEHYNEGLVYYNGLGLNTINADGTGATADAQFGVSSGAVADEDIYSTISAVVSTTGLPIYYMLGASAEWQKHTEAGFSMRTSDGTTATRLAWNEYTGGAWQLTEVANNDFVLCHVFATTEKDNPMIAVMGQGDYANVIAARAGAKTEIHSLVLDDLLFPEIRPIATVIFKTNTSYASAINALIASTSDGDDYIDWRSETISRTEISTSDHNSLTSLQGGTANEYYHFTSAEYTEVTGFFSTTDITGAQAETLSDGSNADGLHVHTASGVTDFTTAVQAISINNLSEDASPSLGGNLDGGANDINVNAGQKFILDGSGGNTYLTFNSTSSKLELWVEGVKKQQWG